jgi:phospholipid transport system substrate-binding protein
MISNMGRCLRQLCPALAFAVAVILSLSTTADPIFAKTPDPLDQVKQGIKQVMGVFQDPQMPLAQRRDKLRQLAEDYFDFDDMARSALGYHWRALNPAQRAQFTQVFTLFIEDAYLSKLENYTVEKIREEARTAKITFTGETFDGSDYAEVMSTILVPDQQDPLRVDYLMHRGSAGWRVYDLTVDSISIIANYRNQFNRVINNDGFDQLITDLKSKQEQLQQYMDSMSSPSNSRPQASVGAGRQP